MRFTQERINRVLYPLGLVFLVESSDDGDTHAFILTTRRRFFKMVQSAKEIIARSPKKVGGPV